MKMLEAEIDRLRGLDAIREDVANLLQEEIAELTKRLEAATAPPEPPAPPPPSSSPAGADERFRRAKVAISKVLHPNNFAHDKIAATIRGEIFKELWPEIELIERR
jgi:hypothetical protein